MFTGLVQDLGTVERLVSGQVTEVWIRTALPVEQFSAGESIACDGVCLTVVEKSAQVFKVQAAPETLRRTTLESWRAGAHVNLERALKLGDHLGGHLVQGHVDGVETVLERRQEGGSLLLTFSLSAALAPFFIEKGSVTIDGVSLTVTFAGSDRFGVMLIPETQVRTTLGQKQVGQKVNIEADVIGKYVVRLIGQRKDAGLSEELLRRAGFTAS